MVILYILIIKIFKFHLIFKENSGNNIFFNNKMKNNFVF